MPSEWLRWVWDKEQGEQPPEFRSEKQAKRILSLLIGHANVLAFTLIHGPQHYEPRFYSHKIVGNWVPVIDEWCCGYVKGIALDPKGWQPLLAHVRIAPKADANCARSCLQRCERTFPVAQRSIIAALPWQSAEPMRPPTKRFN
jgi:yecA family protein